MGGFFYIMSIELDDLPIYDEGQNKIPIGILAQQVEVFNAATPKGWPLRDLTVQEKFAQDIIDRGGAGADFE